MWLYNVGPQWAKRLTMTGANTITYEMTYSDPEVFTAEDFRIQERALGGGQVHAHVDALAGR